MINLVTPEQFIVGLKSYRQIYRAVLEHHFKNVVFCYYKPSPIKPPRKLIRLIKKMDSPIRIVSIIPINSSEDKQKIGKKVDLIISYGSSKLHSIVKPIINDGCALYCIEQLPTRVSSYDTIGIANGVIPNLIFNECNPKRDFNLRDTIYFMADISLALKSCLECKEDNNFIFDCAISGIINFLLSYQVLQTDISAKEKKQCYIKMAHADILMKNAYNIVLAQQNDKTFSNIHHWLVYCCQQTLLVAKKLFATMKNIVIETLKEYRVTQQQIIDSLLKINSELEKNEEYKNLLVDISKEVK